MNARTLVRIAAVVVAIGVVGWQWWWKRQAEPVAHASAAAPAVASASTSAATSVTPASPATMKLGRLTLTACELKQPHSAATTPAFCTKFPVPENRA
ncbi:MAG: alpha/beta hydrolase, partial [Rhodanobacteraceae bacterium]